LTPPATEPAGAERAGISRVAVVGAGLMGRQLAGVLAAGGLAVALHDTRAEILGTALESARRTAADLGGPADIRAVPGLAAAVEGADLVVEAIVEELAAKRDLFGRLSAAAPEAILATNTSVLPVTAIAGNVPDPRRCLGTHWWNPPQLIPIVEVVPAAGTAPDVVARVEALLRDLGKTPVRVRRDVPGSIGNRLQHALWREAIALVAAGVCDAETVDLVVRNTIGLRLGCMGPVENADYVGLDLTLAIHEALLPSLDRDPAPSPLLRELVRRGDLGAKTGRGFRSWPPGARQRAADRLAAHVSAQLTPPSQHCTREQAR
jgi:3-hydroxybutyryl-CoA dehydrogenase